MFPPTTDPATQAEQKRIAMAAHGLTVVELRRSAPGRPWSYVRDSALQPPDHRADAVRAHRARRRTPAPADRGRPGRPRRARHAEQLRRRHHPVGHRAVRRGELQPVLRRERHARDRPVRHPDERGRSRLVDGRPALRRPPAGLRERGQPVRLDRRGRPRGPHLDPGQAHRPRPLQARGRDDPRGGRRPGRRLLRRRRALRVRLQVRVEQDDASGRDRRRPRAQQDAARRRRPLRRAVHR